MNTSEPPPPPPYSESNPHLNAPVQYSTQVSGVVDSSSGHVQHQQQGPISVHSATNNVSPRALAHTASDDVLAPQPPYDYRPAPTHPLSQNDSSPPAKHHTSGLNSNNPFNHPSASHTHSHNPPSYAHTPTEDGPLPPLPPRPAQSYTSATSRDRLKDKLKKHDVAVDSQSRQISWSDKFSLDPTKLRIGRFELGEKGVFKDGNRVDVGGMIHGRGTGPYAHAGYGRPGYAPPRVNMASRPDPRGPALVPSRYQDGVAPAYGPPTGPPPGHQRGMPVYESPKGPPPGHF